MIYEWAEELRDFIRAVRHWFIALTCKKVYHYHELRWCREYEDKHLNHSCDWRHCPLVWKEQTDEDR